MAAKLHLSCGDMAPPRYRINPGSASGAPFAVVELGPLEILIGDSAELRRLSDVCANTADVLEDVKAQAQERRRASRCCPTAQHDIIRSSDVVWATLTSLGFQFDGMGGRLDLRNCWCGTTLSRPVKDES